MSRDSEHHGRLLESEHRRENKNVSRGTLAGSPLISAHTTSLHPNISNASYAGIPVIPVSCGDDDTKVLLRGINDEMKVDDYLNTIQVMIVYGLGPKPSKIYNSDAWDIWHTRRIMKVAQTLQGEAMG